MLEDTGGALAGLPNAEAALRMRSMSVARAEPEGSNPGQLLLGELNRTAQSRDRAWELLSGKDLAVMGGMCGGCERHLELADLPASRLNVDPMN